MSEAQAKDPRNALPVGTLDGLDTFALPGLDVGIAHYVAILRSQGIETCESCEGGTGHAFPEPTINFFGQAGEGLRAVAAAMTYGLPIAELRRVWSVQDSELVGPLWAITFRTKSDLGGRQRSDRREA